MRGFLARLFITAFGLWIADAILGGIRFDSLVSLWLAAFLLGVVNALVRPVVILLTFPITLVTLGLFILVINGGMLMLVAWTMPSFHIERLGSAILASIIVGLTAWMANAFVGHKGKVEMWRTGGRGRG